MKIRIKRKTAGRKTAGRYDFDAPYAPPKPIASPRDKEEYDRFMTTLDSRVDTHAILDRLFNSVSATKARERAKAKKLFNRGEVAATSAPMLQPDVLKTPPVEADAAGAPVKTASIHPRVDAWFEKNAQSLTTEAQRRYPELLQVSSNRR